MARDVNYTISMIERRREGIFDLLVLFDPNHRNNELTPNAYRNEPTKLHD